MAYSKYTWSVSDPITQERMNHIEDGIADAHSNASVAESKADSAINRLNTVDTTLSNVSTVASQAALDANEAMIATGYGRDAWQQIQGLLEYEDDGVTIKRNLATRIQDDEGQIANIATLQTWITDATAVGNQVFDVVNNRFKNAESLAERIGEINRLIGIATNTANGASTILTTNNIVNRLNALDANEDLTSEPYIMSVPALITELKAARGKNTTGGNNLTLDARLDFIDGGGNAPSRTLPDIITEINNAHRDNVTDDTLDKRLDDIDNVGSSTNQTHLYRISQLETEINDARQGSVSLDARLDSIDSTTAEKVAKVDIKKTLTYQTDDNSVLQARQGYLLKEAIDAIDSGSTTAINELDTRIDTIEDELDAARVQIGTDKNSGDPIYGTLDNRFDSVEARATQLETDVNKIASELAMYDIADTIQNNNTRIDTIEENVTALDSDINTATTGLKAKISVIESDLNTTTTGLKDKVSALENSVNDASTGLAATKAIADSATSNINTLDTRVTTLEGKDTIVYDKPTSGSNFTEGMPNIDDPLTTADYLIQDDDDKYYYWRYFGQEVGWQLISGAGGGTGSSSGVILTELPDVSAGNPNMDYFIGTNNIGYTHYRFVEGENGAAGHYIKILPKNLATDLSVDAYGGLVAHTISDDQTNVLANFYALNGVTYTPNYDPNDANTLVSQTLQFTGTDGQALDPIVIVGGGGGSGAVYTVRIETTSPISRSIPANSTDPITITAKVVMKQGQDLVSGATATGQIQYRENGTSTWLNGDRIEVEAAEASMRFTIPNDTYFTVDVTKYLQVDKTMQIRLVIDAHPESEEESVVRYQTFSISKVNMSIAAEAFDYASVKNGNFQFNYRCFGVGITKIVHFVMDGSDIVTPVTTTSSNAVLQQVIPMTDKTNGMHTFQVYFVTNTGLESNRLNYFILYNTDTTREAPLIGAAAESTSIVDGDEIVVNYSVNTIGSEKTDSVEIELYTLDANEEENIISTTTLTNVDNNVLASPPYRTFNYPSLRKNNPSDPDPDPITVYIRFTATHGGLSDSQTVSVQVRYLSTTYDLQPETNNLLFSYSAYGRSNNDAGKDTYIYEYTRVNGDTIDFTGTFNNFNWATDGYVDGESLIIGGGATLNINVPIFNSKFNNISIEENNNIETITTNGRTIEIDYEVLSTTNLNATIIDCMTTGVNPKGFRVTPQNCYLLNSGSNIDIDDTGFIKNEENVAAAYLNPGMRTHLTLVIEPMATTLAADNTYHQSANIYINGEFANSCPYSNVGNDFDNNATITIGSDTCLIKLYSIKLYNRGLTEAKVLHNYAVAPVATRDKITRLEDNDVLDQAGNVDYEKARKKYTCLLLTGMGTVNGIAVPTMAPYKGYPSVVGRTKNNEPVGKTESGLLLTKPTNTNSDGYEVEFDLQDKLIDGNNIYGYACSNNVQGTSSQKFPVKNLKVYLAKGDDTTELAFDTSENISVKKVYKYSINNAAKAAYQSVYPSAASLPKYITDCGENIATTVKNLSEVPTQAEVITLIETYLNAQDTDVGAAYSSFSTGDELIIHPILGYKKSKKVKYALRDGGIGESTLCWKADYMSTDHANTFNANIANTLYSNDDKLSTRWTDQTQYAVYGIKCLLFQQSGTGTPQFVGDGCLNNDKGNHQTFGLETDIPGVWTDEDNNTMCQKWDFRNNTNSLLFFKHDGLFEIVDGKPAASSCLECIYPDEGDLADAQTEYKSTHNGASNPVLDVNYNHFQILSSWLGNRANYWYETNSTKRANKKNIFINEFRNHFNFNHILIYYLFMEYTALCDNRVKNIHMRTDNAGEEKIRIKNTDTYYFEGNNNPNAGPWTLSENLETRTMQEPVMDENGNYQFDQSGNMVLGNINHVFVKDSVLDTIDWEQGENHSNFAIWAPVLYDLDSCFGAENVGYLKVRYDADWNYSLYNKLQFAGFDSILWLQVEDCFQTELKAMAKTLYNRAVGLNYTTFYRQQITDNLASLCPAVTNQDMILKYEKPWTEGYLDYSQDTANPTTSTDEYKYLQRGTRTAQKATFMKQRSMLLASKYDGNEFKQDKITFRAGTLVNQANAIITLTANQKLYHGVQYGDLNDVSKVTRRPNKMYDSENETWVSIDPDTQIPEFVPCQVQNIGDMGNTDGIEIYGASVLNDIGDLSRFHPYQIDVGKAVNLKKLIIGSSASGFSNTSTTKIDGLNNCSLLEEINVCNLKNLTSLSLENNGFIKKVYATGSGLNTLSLPRGGVLDTIAYGSNTTDITIINQSRLTTFSYENSDNNNYANVTRLWIENTPNIPIKDIITARLTTLSSADTGLRAGGLRIIGINLNLGDDSSFLQLLVSDLAKGTYLTAKGSHIEGNTDYPTITGTIRITEIRESLLAKLNEIYPNLDIIANRVTREYTIEYRNWDNTLLYTDHRTNEENYIDPVYDTNPVTNAPYIPTPTKPSDAQYIYRFGTYDNQNRYRRYSGWQYNGTTNNPTGSTLVNGDTVFIAVYPTTVTQVYTVTWYDEANGNLIDSMDVEYGTDLSGRSSPIENGTLLPIKSGGNVIKVFKGWSCPLGKITQNVNVYGQWESSTINDATQSVVMNTLTAADIYALSRTSNTTKQRLLQDQLGSQIMIKMGHDFEYTDGVIMTNLLDSGQSIILDGTASNVEVYNDIKPLASNGDWTIAIDYKLLMDSKLSFTNMSEGILASCYQNANSSIVGFKVFIDIQRGATVHPVKVTWGTSEVIIDYVTTDYPASVSSGDLEQLYFHSYRNVIVLSHNSTEPDTLRVTYVVPNTTNNNALLGSNYGTSISSVLLTWSNINPINTPLILGGNYSGSTTTIEENETGRRPAQGIIYWAKYWNADLGETNCQKLAAWPHETIPFYLNGYNGASEGKSTEQIYLNSELSFVAAQGVGDRYMYTQRGNQNPDSNDVFGWHQSWSRPVCNNLLYNGMPEAYQSIIKHTRIKSIARTIQLQTNVWNETDDYLFLPALREVNESSTGNDVNGAEVNASWLSPWSWMVLAEKTNVLGFVSGSSQYVETKTVTTYAPYLYRFLGAYIKDTARIFDVANDPTNIRNLAYRSSTGTTTPITIQSGDVWIKSDHTAWMYFSAADIEEGERINEKEAGNNGGGWRAAIDWNLRSYNLNAQSASENLFMRITAAGEILTTPTASINPGARLVCPEFTV